MAPSLVCWHLGEHGPDRVEFCYGGIEVRCYDRDGAQAFSYEDLYSGLTTETWGACSYSCCTERRTLLEVARENLAADDWQNASDLHSFFMTKAAETASQVLQMGANDGGKPEKTWKEMWDEVTNTPPRVTKTEHVDNKGRPYIATHVTWAGLDGGKTLEESKKEHKLLSADYSKIEEHVAKHYYDVRGEFSKPSPPTSSKEPLTAEMLRETWDEMTKPFVIGTDKPFYVPLEKASSRVLREKYLPSPQKPLTPTISVGMEEPPHLHQPLPEYTTLVESASVPYKRLAEGSSSNIDRVLAQRVDAAIIALRQRVLRNVQEVPYCKECGKPAVLDIRQETFHDGANRRDVPRLYAFFVCKG